MSKVTRETLQEIITQLESTPRGEMSARDLRDLKDKLKQVDKWFQHLIDALGKAVPHLITIIEIFKEGKLAVFFKAGKIFRELRAIVALFAFKPTGTKGMLAEIAPYKQLLDAIDE